MPCEIYAVWNLILKICFSVSRRVSAENIMDVTCGTSEQNPFKIWQILRKNAKGMRAETFAKKIVVFDDI